MSRIWTKMLVMSIACWAGSAQVTVAEPKVDLAELHIGSHVEIGTVEDVSSSRRSSIEYLGTIKEVTAKAVTIADVSVTQRAERSTPVLRTIPYLKRFFRNVGISRTHLDEKTVVVQTKDIASIELLDEKRFLERTAVSARSDGNGKARPGP